MASACSRVSKNLELGGPDTEYLLLEYAHGDKLYVPVHQLDRLSRYVAPGGHTPPLHRLGTAEWAQVKEKTKKAVADIAKDLLELYATREIVSGHAFSGRYTVAARAGSVLSRMSRRPTS